MMKIELENVLPREIEKRSFELMRVFLMEEQPYILLMDEPEISLHIEWQYKLFEEIRHLNPNCQIITSTHSPSLFGDGWGDKLVFVEDLIKVKS